MSEKERVAQARKKWEDEPASIYQKSFLFKCNIDIPKDLTKSEAARLISKILKESPK